MREFPELPADHTATAEKRLRTALKTELGDNVEQVLKAYSNASESGADELTPDEDALASVWPKAYEKQHGGLP